MPVDAHITDPRNRNRATIDYEGSLNVASVPPDVPKIGAPSRYRYYDEFLGSTGAGSGTTNMSVDGSVTPQTFYISAAPDYDIRINKLAIVLVDSSIAYNKFGAIAALTNGFSLTIEESGDTTTIIDAAKTTGEFITNGGEAREFVTLANFDAGNNNAFVLELDIGSLVPGGIRIGRGTLDSIKATVSDDLTGLVNFTVNVLGYSHYPILEKQ